MSSQHVAQLGEQLPRIASVPPYVTTAGPEAVDLAASTGLVADPWQSHVLDGALGEDERGMWTAPEVGVWIPRQNGKGTLIEIRVLAGLFHFHDELIVWSAHEYKTVHRGFLRICALVKRTPELDRLVKRYWESHSEQGIELKTGERLLFVARSRASIRGFTAPTVILDEAQYLTAEMMAAQFPVMATISNWQIWYLGTPPDDPDAWVYELKEDGETGRAGLAWYDYGADLDMTRAEDRAQLDDRQLWYRHNPGLVTGRITERFVIVERRRLRDKFASERLGVWKPRAVGGGVIDAKRWRSLVDVASRRAGDVALGVAISPMRQYAAIGLYGLRADTVGHLQILDYRAGTDWLIDRLVELRDALDPVGIGMSLSVAASLRVQLDLVGIAESEDPEQPARGDLMVVGPRGASAACGQLLDAIRQDALRHIDQQPLNDAVAVAKTRVVGDTVSWAHKDGEENDICALDAVTLARHVFTVRAHIVVEYDPLANIY